MFAKVDSITIHGIKAISIEVQICIAPGIPCFNIVGLPDKIVAESKERVRAAITAIGMQFPPKRITVNLSPANISKIGNHYDLAIAVGIISLLQEVPFKKDISNYIIMGELALDSSIMPVSSILPAAIYASELKKGIICPWLNRAEVRISKNKDSISSKNLKDLIACLNGNEGYAEPMAPFLIEEEKYPDMQDVKNQDIAKRAIEIAAAGGHNVLMQGPPGTGKSMLAKRMPSIMPELCKKEILEINLIASVCGKFGNKIYKTRPFREPHHSSSTASIVGGGRSAEPGEITLAHNGILFLDELPEFSKSTLEALRQPLESGSILVSRANAKIVYPANFQFVAAMNPCKCGYLGSGSKKECKNNANCSKDYVGKISGPILDRIDIFAEVSNVDIFLATKKTEETSDIIKSRVKDARLLQQERYKDQDFSLNCHMDQKAIEEHIKIDLSSQDLLKKVVQKNFISMRKYSRVLKVARTIADLDKKTKVSKNHIAEALFYAGTNT